MSEATLIIEPRPLAERLRVRKGHIVRLMNWEGELRDFRVTHVAMPDYMGRCEVRCESVD